MAVVPTLALSWAAIVGSIVAALGCRKAEPRWAVALGRLSIALALAAVALAVVGAVALFS